MPNQFTTKGNPGHVHYLSAARNADMFVFKIGRQAEGEAARPAMTTLTDEEAAQLVQFLTKPRRGQL